MGFVTRRIVPRKPGGPAKRRSDVVRALGLLAIGLLAFLGTTATVMSRPPSEEFHGGDQPGEPAIDRYGVDPECGGTNRAYYDRMYHVHAVVLSDQEAGEDYRQGRVERCASCPPEPGKEICWLYPGQPARAPEAKPVAPAPSGPDFADTDRNVAASCAVIKREGLHRPSCDRFDGATPSSRRLRGSVESGRYDSATKTRNGSVEGLMESLRHPPTAGEGQAALQYLNRDPGVPENGKPPNVAGVSRPGGWRNSSTTDNQRVSRTLDAANAQRNSDPRLRADAGMVDAVNAISKANGGGKVAEPYKFDKMRSHMTGQNGGQAFGGGKIGSGGFRGSNIGSGGFRGSGNRGSGGAGQSYAGRRGGNTTHKTGKGAVRVQPVVNQSHPSGGAKLRTLTY